MTTQTPTPNAEQPVAPSDPATGRNDSAIDPDGKLPDREREDTAKGNSFSPDFVAEPEPDSAKPGVPRDADIDTDGG